MKPDFQSKNNLCLKTMRGFLSLHIHFDREAFIIEEYPSKNVIRIGIEYLHCDKTVVT